MLLRVSRYRTGEPHFGKSRANRFDDCAERTTHRFGVCYCGFDLITGVAETLLHDELPKRGVYQISSDDIQTRQLITMTASSLTLVDLTGVQLKNLVGDGKISSTTDYTFTQSWSKALHQHPQKFDGIFYMSRHLNDRAVTAIFDRARTKLSNVQYTPLMDVVGMTRVMLDLKISLVY